MDDYIQIISRLAAAVLIGSIIGLDRNLHGKPTGLRTLSLVALGSSLVTMTGMDFAMGEADYDVNAVSRVIQGVITGIGFLGAGVIVRGESSERVRGLTTAASIWVTAALGIVCGTGSWKIAIVAVVLVLLIFLIGGPLERTIHRRWSRLTEKEREEISRLEE
jgi:putative Mg2+ transporter-C (MgtC) family protein